MKPNRPEQTRWPARLLWHYFKGKGGKKKYLFEKQKYKYTKNRKNNHNMHLWLTN